MSGGQVIAGRSHVIRRVRLNGEAQPLFFNHLFLLAVFPSLFQSTSCVNDLDVFLGGGFRPGQRGREFRFKQRAMKLPIPKWTVPVPGFSFSSALVAPPASCPSAPPASDWTAEGGRWGPAPDRSRCAASEDQPRHLTFGEIKLVLQLPSHQNTLIHSSDKHLGNRGNRTGTAQTDRVCRRHGHHSGEHGFAARRVSAQHGVPEGGLATGR